MIKRNDQGREIWFSRFLWSYMPAHWKGVAYPVVLITVTGTLSVIADEYAPGLFFVPLVIGIALSIWMCERHSPSRRKGS
jgi:hypothetical protein